MGVKMRELRDLTQDEITDIESVIGDFLEMNERESKATAYAIDRSVARSTAWQDIATAPRDGTDILVANAINGAVYIVAWDEDINIWTDFSFDEEYEDGFRRYRPDFWMPLPKPPVGNENG
jgi:hypothetical protein